MECRQCGGGLPPKSDICTYCGTLNDTDLRAIHHFTENEPTGERNCPHCEIRLHTIDLEVGQRFLIERCGECLGVFFDPNELEALVDISVSHVHEIDFTRINTLLAEQGRLEQQTVKYVKCPICTNFMNRKSYGSRSGVVIDWCKEHGVWLDGGELGLIFKWAKAGGQVHDAQRKEERAKYAAQQAALAAQNQAFSTEPMIGQACDHGVLSSVISLVSDYIINS